jgi:DNA-binding FadR family transcriptional regulator
LWRRSGPIESLEAHTVTRATRTEDITRVLRDEILRGQWRPGERLPSERELAARFQTTRGIARVALKKLEQLGVASVEPGGARVQPVSQASLDVVGHLLELQRPPDPALVDQILEVLGALIAANARVCVERGPAEDLERALRLIGRLRAPGLDGAAHAHLVHELAHVFLEGNDNIVMHILRRSLRTELFGRLRSVGVEVGGPRPDPRPVWATDVAIDDHARELARAVRERDGLAAYEAVHQIWSDFRGHVRGALEAARGGPQAQAAAP